MDRRDFLQTGAAAAVAAPAPRARKQAKKANLKLATQHSTSDEVLRIMAALGVNHVCSTLPSRKLDQAWSAESLTRLRERVESFGLKLEMAPLPLSSAYITRSEYPAIMLGKSPDRERAADEICEMIRNTAKAGIPALKYNMSILGVVRSASTPGRGGSRYSTFVYDKAVEEQPGLTEAGNVSADDAWERITWFLKRVIPVADEYKVRMACHPHDPGMPEDKGFRGVHRVLGSVAGLKRFVDIMPSKCHGLNFCQGTVSEMLKDPKREILDVIRYFGTREKIFNVHFRNIKGGFLNFQETFPDDGDVDLIKAIRVYKEIGYDGMLMPDHVPHIQGDDGGRQAFAFAFGYIRALIQMVESEG